MSSPADMFTPDLWLVILGIGEDGWDGLALAARSALAGAEILYGGVRHLDFIPAAATSAQRVAWPSPMRSAVDEILTRHRGQKRIAVLGSGDPMLYGVGVLLTQALSPGEFLVIPQVSAFSLACARLGWPAADTTLVSLVGRSIEQVFKYLMPGQRFIIYSEDGTTPAKVAGMLTQRGYGASTVNILERLGGPGERSRSAAATDLGAEPCDKLNVMAVCCVADASVRPLSLLAGLPDDAYETDGQLTKREIRAATLARLAPLPGQTLWDVGAGTGSIGIEWMRAHPACTCTAFETRQDRALRIEQNAKQLGVPTLAVVAGAAPAAFHGLPSPDAIFIGGGMGDEGMFENCWQRLRAGGRLVVNAVTIASEAHLASWHREYGGELVRLQVARAEQIGGTYAWRQMMPITQWAVTKP